jgi:FtsH-binding integral membrane protein
MKELGEALKIIFDKIGQFLDLFDLSFFISGTVAAAGIAFWGHRANAIPYLQLPNWILVVVVLVYIYCCGLVCFAVGRILRMCTRASNRIDNQFKKTLAEHGLDAYEPFHSYLGRTGEAENSLRGIWALYIRLWADLRTDPKMVASTSLLNRYWVMAATYDGVAFALLVWGLVAAVFTLGWTVAPQMHWTSGVPIVFALIGASFACMHEAGRYSEYQIYELVATTAARLGVPKYSIPNMESPASSALANEAVNPTGNNPAS